MGLKKLIVLISATVAMASANAYLGNNKSFVKAYVGDTFYPVIKIKTTTTTSQKKFTNSAKGMTFGIGAGHFVTKELNINVDVSSRNFTYSSSPVKQKIRNYIAFVGGSYTMLKTGAAAPYIAAGAGYSKLDPKTPTGEQPIFKKFSGIAYYAGLGTIFKVTKSLDADLSYRYMMLGKFEDKDKTFKKKLSANEVTAGLVFRF